MFLRIMLKNYLQLLLEALIGWGLFSPQPVDEHADGDLTWRLLTSQAGKRYISHPWT